MAERKQNKTPTVVTDSGEVREVFSVHPDIKAGVGTLRVTTPKSSTKRARKPKSSN